MNIIIAYWLLLSFCGISIENAKGRSQNAENRVYEERDCDMFAKSVMSAVLLYILLIIFRVELLSGEFKVYLPERSRRHVTRDCSAYVTVCRAFGWVYDGSETPQSLSAVVEFYSGMSEKKTGCANIPREPSETNVKWKYARFLVPPSKN